MKNRSYNTTSAILASPWFINKQWAEAHLPIVAGLLKGQHINAGMLGAEEEDKDEKSKEALSIQTSAGVVYKVGYYTDFARLPEGSIAMISINGPLLKYGGACSYGMVDKAQVIQQAANAPNIKGIIFDIDSPGGQVSGTSMVADIIKSIQKPTIAVIDDGMAASAGYWIATAADEIYLTKETSEVGSVGVYCTLYDWKTYFEKEGLPVIEVYAPQSTEKNLDYREALGGNDKLLKDSLKVLADQFIKTVETNRDGKLTSDKWNAGAMFYAKDAQKIGLIDGIKSLDQVVQRMDQLIANKNSSTSKSQNMSFKKSAAVAKVDGFQPVTKGVAIVAEENGVNVSEASMTAIEAAIEAGETAAAELVTANANLATATTDLNTANASLTTVKGQLTTANASLATAQDRIVELEAMGGKETKTSKEEDKQEDVADNKKYETSFDRMLN